MPPMCDSPKDGGSIGKLEYGIQFYDAQIIAAAERLGCASILTEDLNDGQMYCGIIAVNPFSGSKASDTALRTSRGTMPDLNIDVDALRNRPVAETV